MQNGIGFFVKIFSSEAYRDDFLNGSLYMNPIKFFREYEDKHAGNVGDKNEALSAWLQPEELRLVFNFQGEELVIPGSDLAAPIALRRNHFDTVNVMCLMAIHSHGISTEDIISDEQLEKLKEYFIVPEDAINLGKYAVIILDTDTFLSKVKRAAQKLCDSGDAVSLRAQLVTYYDDKSTLSLDKEEEAIFHKQKSYEHQSEYRISLDRGVEDIGHYVLQIGSLDGIAIPILTNDINNHFQIVAKPA